MHRVIILIDFFFFGYAFAIGTAFATPADEIYIRAGAITNLETCINVAGDREALELLAKLSPSSKKPKYIPQESFQDASNDLINAERLIQELAHSLRTHPGFGTLWLCAHIVEARSKHSFVKKWFQKLDGEGEKKQRELETTAAMMSGRDHTHNALVVSFADFDRQQQRRLIKGTYISRLLATPKLLPPEYYGGIVLRDAIVEGPLVFNHATVTTRFNFTNVTFQGGQYSTKIFKKFINNSNSDKKTFAIIIYGATFRKRVSFYDSYICGDIKIDRSKFDESVFFEDIVNLVESSQEHCYYHESKKQPDIFISKSHFDRGMVIKGKKSKIANLACYSSSGYFAVQGGVQFEGDLKLVINSFHDLNIENSTFKSNLEIDANQIDGDIYIKDIDISQSKDNNKNLLISNNLINQAFYFISTDKELLNGYELDFSNNTVNSNTIIKLPSFFDGKINLTGGNFNGGLTIEEIAEQHNENSENRNPYVKIEKDRWDNKYCSEISAGSNPKDHQVFVRLDAAKVHNLDWRLPIICKYRWSGVGLTYDIWGDASQYGYSVGLISSKSREKQSGSISARELEPEKMLEKQENWRVLKAWRTAMANFEPDSLSMMADYLASHGRFNESRKILVEAKRLNYLSMCAPSKWLPVCTWENLSDFFSWDKLFEFDQFLNIAALVFLAPGGYGARPEFAMVWIFIVTALCWGIYCWYSYCRGSRYRPAYTKLQEFWRQLKEADKKNQQETSRFSNFKKEFEKSLEFHNPDFQPGRRPQDIRPLDEYEDELRKMANQLNVPLSPELNFHDLKVIFAGDTKIYGFSLFQTTYKPISFGLLQYSIDTMVPVISLHAYSSYYPEYKWIRRLTVFQHLLGWWFLTVFLASATIL